MYSFHFGYLGAALAVVSSKGLELLLLILYIKTHSLVKNAKFFGECFSEWGPILSLGMDEVRAKVKLRVRVATMKPK
jgi:Na+-driven multidrug efflux pump